MPLHRFLSAAFRALLRLVPRSLHTRRMKAGARVLDLTPSQREELARNLRGMLRPKAA
jgi:hypothetical protein